MNDLTCTTEQPKAITGFSGATITRLVQQGMPRKAKNTFELPDVVQWLMRERTDTRESETDKEVRKRYYLAQTKKSEIETAQIQKELLPVQEAQHLISEAINSVVSSLDGLAARIATEAAGLEEVGAIEDLCERELRSLRAMAAERIRGFDAAVGAQPKPRSTRSRRRDLGLGKRESSPAAG